MKTKRRNIRLTDEQLKSLDVLATLLSISGQRDATFQPLIQWLADTASGVMTETAWLLEIAGQVAAGGDLAELLETTPPPMSKEVHDEPLR